MNLASSVMREGSRRRARKGGFVSLQVAGLAALLLGAFGYAAYLMWPRWPGDEPGLQAPSLPIMVGETAFNFPPAAIRAGIQRHAGAQDRIDLAYQWPSLKPPEPDEKATPARPPQDSERIFVTVAIAQGALGPIERIRTIYPRYLADDAYAGEEGLATRAFRDDTPYRGEDLIYDPSAPDLFVVRCTRNAAQTRGTCLLDRRVGTADITFRFPRDWLSDWRGVGRAIEHLMGSFRQAAG